jgi:hypothetical protein
MRAAVPSALVLGTPAGSGGERGTFLQDGEQGAR